MRKVICGILLFFVLLFMTACGLTADETTSTAPSKMPYGTTGDISSIAPVETPTIAPVETPNNESGETQSKHFTHQDADALFPIGSMSLVEHAQKIYLETEALKTEIARLHDETLDLLRRNYEAFVPDGNEEEFQRTLAEPYEAYYAARLRAAEEAEVYAESVAGLVFMGGTGTGTARVLNIYVIYRNLLEELRNAAEPILPL